MMLRYLLCLLVLGLGSGCDTGSERPLTLAERVAGVWTLTDVRDGGLSVRNAFEQKVGTVEMELESVGCCAVSADYRLTVTRSDGEVVETIGRYQANDTPTDGDDFIVLVTEGGVFTLAFAYDFDSAFTGMMLTGLNDAEEMTDEFVPLGIDYPFEEVIVFEFDLVR